MEIYVNGIAHIILSLWGTYTTYLLLEVFYDTKHISNKEKIILFGINSIFTDLAYFFINIPSVTLIINWITLSIITIRYQKDIKKSITSMLLITLFMVSIESIVLGIVSYKKFMIISSNSLIPLEAMFLGKLLAFITVIGITKFKALKENYEVPHKHWFILATISTISICNIVLLIGYKDISTTLRTMAICGMAMINIGIIYLYNMTIISTKEQMEKEIYRQENEYYKNQFSMLEKTSKKDREVKHNLTNILLALRGAVTEENKTTATKHIENMIDNYNQKEYIKTGIPTIDSVINFKIGKAIENQINYQVKAVIPIDIEVDFIDVGIVLGNLLDNAIEATSKLDVEKRMLKLDIQYKHKRIGISVENTFNGELKYRKGELISIKDDSNNHGIGLKSVKSIAQKYGDYIYIDNTDDKFIVKLSIGENQP